MMITIIIIHEITNNNDKDFFKEGNKIIATSYARPAQTGLIRLLGPLRPDSVIKFVSVLFGKCTTLVVTKY